MKDSLKITIFLVSFLFVSNLFNIYLLTSTKTAVENANQECVELLDPVITKAAQLMIENDKLKNENSFLKVLAGIKTSE